MKSRKVIWLVAAVDLLALVAFVALLPERIEDVWVGLSMLSMLVILVGSTPVRIPALRTSVSSTDPFVFTALGAFGPMPACVVAAAGVIGAAIVQGKDRKPLHMAFNLGNVVLSIAVASVVYMAAGGVPGTPAGDQIWQLVLATTVYFILNTGLVSLAIVIDRKRNFLETWTSSGLWTGVSAYAGLTLAVGLLYALQKIGVEGLALGIPPCWLLVAFYRTHKERQEESQRRISQVEEMNVDLEDKVRDRTGELQHALLHIEEANTKLRGANDRLVEANRTKSEFLANVSHELRTPLNAIIGFSDLLGDTSFGKLGEQQTEFVADIHESGEHLLRLINEILDLSKVEAGKMEVHVERFEVPRSIRDSVAMLRPQASRKELTVEIECRHDVQLAELDPGMFRQVLVNLLSNAVKFTPEQGRVTIRARREAEALIVEVADTGIGIGEQDLGRVFEEFFQVDGSYSRSFGGTGLGLALVRRMVELQGGVVSARSKPDHGSTFTCRFPGAMIDEAPEVAVEQVRAAVPDARSGRRRVLVVEDNPFNRKLARNILTSRGYEVFEATTGEEALSVFAGTEVDLVLMDIQLPGMDGLEVTRRLKADPANAALPIVALTAHAQVEDEERARAAGCVGYITKPIRMAEFPRQVASYLEVQGVATDDPSRICTGLAASESTATTRSLRST